MSREDDMTPRPKALALSLCDQIIVDERTKKVSLIGIFLGMGVEEFPSDPQRFSVAASLTGTSGSATIELRVVRLATGEQVYEQRGTLTLPDRTDIVNVLFRVRTIRFPAAGFYQFQLLVDDELVVEAQRQLRVYRG
jgi:hypothetical protein